MMAEGGNSGSFMSLITVVQTVLPSRPQTSTEACLLESERGYRGPGTGDQQSRMSYHWYD